jgi:hypothetical protein
MPSKRGFGTHGNDGLDSLGYRFPRSAAIRESKCRCRHITRPVRPIAPASPSICTRLPRAEIYTPSRFSMVTRLRSNSPKTALIRCGLSKLHFEPGHSRRLALGLFWTFRQQPLISHFTFETKWSGIGDICTVTISPILKGPGARTCTDCSHGDLPIKLARRISLAVRARHPLSSGQRSRRLNARCWSATMSACSRCSRSSIKGNFWCNLVVHRQLRACQGRGLYLNE